MKKSVVASVMALSLGIIMTGCCYSGYQAGANQTQVYCQQMTSTENWQIKGKVTTVGNVSEDTLEKICTIIQDDVHQESWNYLNNSGGKLVVVEGHNIRGYITANYSVDTSDLKDTDEILGYCPKFYNSVGDIERLDVVIASEALSSLQHEFNHVLDYTHNYSSTKEFKAIYKRADSICRQIFDYERANEYYSGDIQEFFAEMGNQYQLGTLDGVDADLEAFMSEVFD